MTGSKACPVEGRRGRPKAQRLIEDLTDVMQLMHLLFIRRCRVVAKHRVHFRIGFCQHVRIVDQVIEREREQPAGGLVPSHKEGQDLIADVDEVEALSALAIDAAQHRLQQIGVLVLIRVCLSAGDQPIDETIHDRDVIAQSAPPAKIEPALQRQLAQTDGRVLEGVRHGEHEGMRLVAVERVEPIRKRADPDRIERQPGHVRGHVDVLLGIKPRPFLHELRGYVAHLRQVAADCHGAERGRENIVRLLPVRLMRPGGEQAVPDDHPGLHQPRSEKFVEPVVVAGFIDELKARHHDQRAAGNFEPKYRPVDFHKLDQVEQRRIALQVEQIADDRMTRGLGNEIQRGLRHHAVSLRASGSSSPDRDVGRKFIVYQATLPEAAAIDNPLTS